ncbi:periplasmic binding protein-like I [Fennellomyces sp. T-0311]|nr:periplasmic binding protein-like I [Fennellomyces sp. T-0311]
MSVADHALDSTQTIIDSTNIPIEPFNNTIPINGANIIDDPFDIRHDNGSTIITPRVIDANWTELKVGVLMPFSQKSNEYTMQLTHSGSSAIRMAAHEINSQQLIPGAYITLVERDSYPKEVDGQAAITQAVFSTISLIQEGVIAVIGDISSSWTSLSALMTTTLQIPQCSFTAVATSLSDKTQYGYFFRTVPTKLLYADAAMSFIVSQGWPTFGILYTDDDIGQQLSESLIMKSKFKGIQVKAYQKFYDNGPESDIRASIDMLMNSGIQIVFVAAEGDAQLAVFSIAGHMGYVNNNTVWMGMGRITDELFEAVNQFNTVLDERVHVSKPIVQKNNTTAITYAAQTTSNLQPISFNDTFSGGVFLFDATLDLSGYPPYDQFVDKWSHLDPNIYPYAGRPNISSNEGLAYSCMMVMAHGFNQVLNNSTEVPQALKKLSDGQLGSYLTPNTFNTSFVGPAGPMLFDQNGDSMASNFKIFNVQHGNEVQIGTVLAGDLTLTSQPFYHDGTSVPPSGIPTRTLLNPGYGSPVSVVIAAIAGLGTLFALFTMAIVILFRKREVFKASSPLFCVLELLGFIFCYTSMFFYNAYRTKVDCIMIPVTFHIGLALVLANLIAKNYRIYRIFNNVFVTKTVVTDVQLLKFSGGILVVVVTLLIGWLCTCQVVPINVPVSRTAYYVRCSFQGPSSSIFTTLLTVVPAAQLAFATFLSIKTRSVGKNYSKYSEYKQIGISVYNIFFSSLIGFVIFSIPTTDYYTRHYLTMTTIVWAITFSMLVLFLPKLHTFFFRKGRNDQAGKRSDISGRRRDNNTNSIGETTTKNRELMSINRLLANPNAIDPAIAMAQNHGNDTETGSNTKTVKNTAPTTIFEAHEARMPVQVVLRYFPFLAAWDMKHVFLFPRVGYFSFFSEKSQKGRVFGYSRATIVSSKRDAYILRIHGASMFDVLIQVASPQELEDWMRWFNSGGTSSSGASTTLTSNTCLTSPTSSTNQAAESSGNKWIKNDSGLTARKHLLAERQESSITLETMDSGISGPLVTELDYSQMVPPVPTNLLSTRRSLASSVDDEELEYISLNNLKK